MCIAHFRHKVENESKVFCRSKFRKYEDQLTLSAFPCFNCILSWKIVLFFVVFGYLSFVFMSKIIFWIHVSAVSKMLSDSLEIFFSTQISKNPHSTYTHVRAICMTIMKKESLQFQAYMYRFTNKFIIPDVSYIEKIWPTYIIITCIYFAHRG